ncbi:MAG: YajQ family cyclic di-GMP-binding protein [Gemmatimonadota bacterium]
MAQQNSFDVSTGADLQEVDNAVNQAAKEVAQRYDFKGTHASITFDRDTATLQMEAPDEYKLDALLDVLKTRLIRRGVPVKNLHPEGPEPASGGRMRQAMKLQQGIPDDAAKRMVKDIKKAGFKKVQAAIQGDEVRVSSPSRDELQAVMAFLKEQDYGVELNFGNYR